MHASQAPMFGTVAALLLEIKSGWEMTQQSTQSQRTLMLSKASTLAQPKKGLLARVAISANVRRSPHKQHKHHKQQHKQQVPLLVIAVVIAIVAVGGVAIVVAIAIVAVGGDCDVPV